MFKRLEKSEWFALGAILALTLITFSRAFSAGYVNWDDRSLIVENPFLKKDFITALKIFFGRSFFSDYMPVTMLSFWADVHLFGINPQLQHSINVLLHLANVVLCYLVLRRWTHSVAVTALVTLVFAMHPVQVESVMWITSRNLLLATFFILILFLVHESRPRSPILSMAEIFVFALSVLSKATTVLAPVIIVEIDRRRAGLSIKQAVRKNLHFVVLAVILAAIRLVAYNVGNEDIAHTALDVGRLVWLPVSILNLVASDLRLIFWPKNLSIIYPVFVPGAEVVVCALGVVCVLAVAAVLARRRRAFMQNLRKAREDQVGLNQSAGQTDGVGCLSFYLLLTLVFLLPVMQILPRGNYLNDRYLYLPLVGVAAIFISLAVQKVKPMILAVCLLILPVLAFARTQVWVSEHALWSDTVAKSPRSAIAHLNLGLSLQNSGQLAEAISEFQQAAALGQGERAATLAYNDLGVIFAQKSSGQLRNLQSAETMFKSSVLTATRAEDAFEARLNLASVEIETGRVEQARGELAQLTRDIQASNDSTSYGDVLEFAQDLQKRIGP